jgi:phage terminase large subunit-like protein
VVAADSETVGGKKTIGLLVDELWLFGKRANAANMLLEAMGGLASRPEGFVIYLSTQSDKPPPAGVFAQKLEEFRDIRDGKIVDPRSLPVLYEFPPALIDGRGLRASRENWYVTNPNLGASVDERVSRRQLAKASAPARPTQRLPRQAPQRPDRPGAARRRLGRRRVWERGIETGLTLDEILERSEVVTVGIDGGGLDDLLGVAVIGRERGTKRWLGWAHALISTIGAERRKANAEDYLRFKRPAT